MADEEQQEPDQSPTPPEMPTVIRPPEGPPIDDITMVRPPDPPPAAEPPYTPPPQAPQAPSAPPPPTGAAPYQPPVAHGYQQYGAPPPVPTGFGLPGAKIPGQIDPETGLQYSDKERLTAGLLQLLPLMLGVAGIGRLYTGHTAIGVVMLVGTITGWVMTCLLIGLLWAIPIWIWGLIDGILMVTNKHFTDAQGRVLR